MDNNMMALDDIVSQFNEESDSNVLAKYGKLVKAIEFFSQRFSLDNMNHYIFEFTLELLQVNKCIYLNLRDNQYQVFATSGELDNSLCIERDEKHDQLVYFHAGLMNRVFIESFVEEHVRNEINAEYGIPIIMDKTLYGMILIDNGAKPLETEEAIIAEALMNLFSLALTNFKSYESLEETKKDLDSKVFNLFAINQASKALLSELNTKYLIDLSLSVFSELTQSRITGIYMYDGISNCYESMGLIDVYNTKHHRPLHLKSANIKNSRLKIVIQTKNPVEMQTFADVFETGIEVLDYNEPEYIINLISDGELLGFVTISNRVNNEPYEKGSFELIESLASSTYVAILNAKHMDELSRQQRIIKDKFRRLQELNRLIKNMNTASDIHNLFELTLDTLKISFGYKTSFIALFNDECENFTIEKHLNFELEEKVFSCSEKLHDLQVGKIVINYRGDDVASQLAEIYTDELYEKVQGMIMIPIIIEDIGSELLGVICLLDVEEGVLSSDENILTLETIANQIAPNVKQLRAVNTIKAEYKEDYKKKFIQDLSEAYREAKETDTEVYTIIAKESGPRLFGESMYMQFKESYTYCYELSTWVTAFICRSLEVSEQIQNNLGFDYEYTVVSYPADSQDVEDTILQIEKNINKVYNGK